MSGMSFQQHWIITSSLLPLQNRVDIYLPTLATTFSFYHSFLILFVWSFLPQMWSKRFNIVIYCLTSLYIWSFLLQMWNKWFIIVIYCLLLLYLAMKTIFPLWLEVTLGVTLLMFFLLHCNIVFRHNAKLIHVNERGWKECNSWGTTLCSDGVQDLFNYSSLDFISGNIQIFTWLSLWKGKKLVTRKSITPT